MAKQTQYNLAAFCKHCHELIVLPMQLSSLDQIDVGNINITHDGPGGCRKQSSYKKAEMGLVRAQ